MSIASEITRLQSVKSDILTAIADKGVTVPAGSALADCPELIEQIEQGGGGAYILDDVPDNDYGEDGDFAIVMKPLVAGDNGTIIPVQDSTSTSCFANTGTSDAYKAFNNSTGDNYNFTEPGYIGYDFGDTPKKILSVSIFPNGYNYSPYYTNLKFIFIQASNNFKNWITLSVATLPESQQWFTCTFENENFYRYYRVFAYSSYYKSYLYVNEIHMNDEQPSILGYKQPNIFRKRCGSWCSDSAICGPASFSPSKGLYRPEGISRNPKSLIPGLYNYTTNSTVTVEAFINSDLFSYGSQQVLVGTSYSAGDFNTGVVQIQFSGYVSSEFLQVNIANGPNSSQWFSEAIRTSDFLSARIFKAVVNAGTVRIYLDGTLKATLTLDNYTEQNGELTNYSFTGNAAASSPGSPQMGVKRITAVSNVDGYVEFDFIAAKDSVTNAFGFVDRKYNIFYGVTGVSELP